MERWRRTALKAERVWGKQEIPAAIRLYRKAAREAEQAGETTMLAVILNNLGRALDQEGDGQGARDALARARDLLTAAADAGDDEAGEYLGPVLRTLGGVQVELGDVDDAIETHRAALALARSRRDDVGTASARTDLGIALKDAGRLSEARDELTGVLELARDQDLDHVTAHALTALGLVAEKLHQPAEARERYNAALPLYERLADPGNAATVRYNLASLHNAVGEWDQAARLLAEAQQQYLAVEDALGVADCHAALASIEIALGHPDRARELHEAAALRFQSGGYRSHLLNSLVDLAAIARDERRFADAARLLAEAGRLADEIGDPLDRHDVELHLGDLCFTAGDEAAARAHYGRSAEIIRAQREQLTREDEALSFFGADRTDNIDRLITLSGEDPASCVTWIERAKGQELLRRLDNTGVPHAPSWPDLRHLLDRLAADDQGRGLLLVHYYARDSVTVAAGLRPGRDPVLVPVEVPLAELRAAPADPRAADWPETERKLRSLVAPVADWAAPGDRVLLCPHDTLHRFPLHAVDLGGQALGERNVVSYLPSAGVLRACLVRRRPATQGAVIFADANPGQPLPLARDQAVALAALLADHGWHVRCHAGPGATVGTLETDLRGPAAPGLAHFAVHGFAAPGSGLDSGLRLADGTLTARELTGARLDGTLVCLGACDTGLSERLAGDELLGLVRSALQAGAGTVLASLWPMDQLSASLLLLDFHRRLLGGTGKADALAAAQQQVWDATIADVLAHLDGTRRRLAGDAGALAAASLAEARLALAAGDASRAVAAAEAAASLEDSADARELRARARLAARRPQNPDYARRPFRDAEHWAPFILIGDPA